MNYGQVRDQVLKLLDQYSVAGQLVSPTYNNQEDYLNRIPALANDAIMQIATTYRKIRAYMRLSDMPSEDLGKEVRYEMPGDFFRFVSGSVVCTTGGYVLHSNDYMMQGRHYLIVPKDEADDYSIEYYRYPMLLADRPKDNDVLDNEPETHRAVPYYVAAFLAERDDPHLGAMLNNKYQELVQDMGAGLSAEVHTTGEVYSFYSGGGC